MIDGFTIEDLYNVWRNFNEGEQQMPDDIKPKTERELIQIRIEDLKEYVLYLTERETELKLKIADLQNKKRNMLVWLAELANTAADETP